MKETYHYTGWHIPSLSLKLQEWVIPLSYSWRLKMQLHKCFRIRHDGKFKNIQCSLQEQIRFVFICSTLMSLLTLLVSLLTRSLLLLFPPLILAVKLHCVLLGGLEGIPVLSLTKTEVYVYLQWLLHCYLFKPRLCLSLICQKAVIQNPFSNGGSPAGEAVGGETRFAYFPATAVSDGTVSVQAATDPTLTQAGGESVLTLNLAWSLRQCHWK